MKRMAAIAAGTATYTMPSRAIFKLTYPGVENEKRGRALPFSRPRPNQFSVLTL